MTSFSLNKLSLIAIFTIAFFSNSLPSYSQSKTFEVSEFDKVVVSPHIEVIFREGNQESVSVESNTESIETFNVEVEKGVLQLYLTGAKTSTKSLKEGIYRTKPMYKGTVLRAIVTYKSANKFSLRGEERFLFESPIDNDSMELSIYGASQVQLKDVTLDELKIVIYGESFVKIDEGAIGFQQIRAYGESSVNLLDVASKNTKLTAYGDGSFQFNASESLKVTSYGEPTVTYKGDAKVKNGLSFGEVSIVKVN